MRPSGFCRDLLKWLNSAVRKSTGSEETARERDEHIRLVQDDARIVCWSDPDVNHTSVQVNLSCLSLHPSRLVSIFQRMLSLALEVDGRPTLQSDKVSQELFLMLITGSFRREHR